MVDHSLELRRKPTNLEAYRNMTAEAARLNILTAYHADLYAHDRTILTMRPDGVHFAWGICSTGTHILMPGYIYNHYSGSLSALRQWHTPIHWYWWNGRKLKPIEFEDLGGYYGLCRTHLAVGANDEQYQYDQELYTLMVEAYRAEYIASLSSVA